MQRNGEQPNGRQRVLIAGGGVAALEAALALRFHAADRVAVELLVPRSRTSGTGRSRSPCPSSSGR